MIQWDLDSINRMQAELIERAQKDHLGQEVLDENRRQNPRYNPTLAWVGRRIVNVGAKIVQLSGDADQPRTGYKPDIHLN